MTNFTLPTIKTLRIIITSVFLSISFLTSSQTIHLVTSPVPGDYVGNPIIFNNKLYIQFVQDFNNTHSNTGYQLAEYTDTSFRLYTNPDQVLIYPYGFGYLGTPIEFNNNIYFQYLSADLTTQLGRFDGQEVTKIPNISNFQYGITSYPWTPIVSDNKLFIPYSNKNDIYLAAFDGSNYQLLDTVKGDSYIGSPIQFDGELYVNYFNQDSGYRLNKYVDTSLVPILWQPWYDHQYDGFPFLYNGKLYGTYHSLLTNETFWGRLDGNQLTRIDIPNLAHDKPIFYQGKVYFLSYTTNSVQLTGYDGNSFIPISNPDASDDGVNNPVLYNNKIYFIYTDVSGVQSIAQCDGYSITFVPNSAFPAGISANFVNAIVYNDKLYFNYVNTATNVTQLASFDGISINVISNPDGGEGYDEKAIIYNNKLYFGYIQDSTILTNLAYLDESILPISLLTFTVQLKKSNAVLNWQTATEINTSYFNIQRSSNGVHFNTINKMIGAGNSSATKNYTYTDAEVTELGISKLYYRLQEVDKDGKINYSSIRTIDLSNGRSLFSVSPNPSKDFINIVSTANVTDAQITITDMNGRALFTTKQNLSAGQQLKISLSQFSKQILIVTIASNNNHEQFKIVKE